MKNDRPILDLELSQVDWYIYYASLIFTLACVLASVYFYMNAGDVIATHMNAKGEIDGYGSPWTLFIVPGTAVLMFIMFHYLLKIPHKYNYMVKITPENAEYEYRKSRKLMLLTLLGSSALLFYVTLLMGWAESGHPPGSMIFFYILVAFTVFGPLAYYLLDNKKNN